MNHVSPTCEPRIAPRADTPGSMPLAIAPNAHEAAPTPQARGSIARECMNTPAECLSDFDWVI